MTIAYISDPGQNWDTFDDLKKLALSCKEAGATYFKPQLFSTDTLYSQQHPYYPWIKKHELSIMQAEEIFEYCKSIGIDCIFSPFDNGRLKWCDDIGVSTIKIAARMSGDNSFVSEASNYGFNAIVSMSPENKHFSVWEFCDLFGIHNVKFLSCVSKYPAQLPEYNLEEIRVLKGVSDHTTSIILPIVASSVGAKTVEKHIYLKQTESPDMCCSISSSLFKEMTRVCNEVGNMRGALQ